MEHAAVTELFHMSSPNHLIGSYSLAEQGKYFTTKFQLRLKGSIQILAVDFSLFFFGTNYKKADRPNLLYSGTGWLENIDILLVL